MKQNNNENAANRLSYVGHVYGLGEKQIKKEILDSLPEKWAHLHKEGYIHIHDLDAYGLTYNCLTFDVDNLDLSGITDPTEQGRIIGLFSFLKLLIEEYGNEQSGGMAFANFDNDIDQMLAKLGVADNVENNAILRSCIRAFILFCNDNHTRMGLVSYYVTLNIGLAKTARARFVAKSVIGEFESLGDMVYKPNIVFKVHEGVNRAEGDPNNDILKQALLCTAKKMIPTYLLCDCEQDKQVDPSLLSVMGCRTRVVDDRNGQKGAIGRGNIDNISINLPRIALEIDREFRASTFEEKMKTLKKRWTDIASVVKEILIDRYKKVIAQSIEDFPTNLRFNLWRARFDEAVTLEDIFKHGTLSIGFIGLSEAIEVLSGKKYYADPDTLMAALGFVCYMRQYCEFLGYERKMNFSLLATSGELISGRFTEIDAKEFEPQVDIFSKGYYTNSFHVDVDSNLPAKKKIQIEGLFHPFCNGGSITYVELGEAPLGNDEGLMELVEEAIASNVHYLGFNFPKDVCDECGASGVFDDCPCCGSKKITRIRRVSGYLEILDGFTKGKKAEEKNKKEERLMRGPKRHISIEGFDGVGKTTVCKLLSERLGCDFVEKPLHHLFDEGDSFEEYVRIRDKVNACPDRDFTASFYGLGSLYMYHLYEGKEIVTDRHLCSNYAWSGNGENDDVYDLLLAKLGKPYLTVVLHAEASTIAARLSGRDTEDPDLAKVAKSDEIYAKMRSFCEEKKLNTLWLHTDNMTPDVIVGLIIGRLKEMKKEPRSDFRVVRLGRIRP